MGSSADNSQAPTGASVKPPAGPGAESARRAIDLLLAFTAERHTLSTRELAEATAIPLPSAYRYVAMLRDMGLLVGQDQGGYHLSARFLALAQAAEAAEPLIDVADPVMRALAADTGETVILVRLVAQAAVCVHRVESSQRLRISFEPGTPLPLTRGASARLLFASLPPSAQERHLAEVAAEDPEAATRLRAEAERAHRRGWATSEQEIDRGIWAAAAAVYDGEAIVAVLSVPSPIGRTMGAERRQMLERVREAAAAVTRTLAG